MNGHVALAHLHTGSSLYPCAFLDDSGYILELTISTNLYFLTFGFLAISNKPTCSSPWQLSYTDNDPLVDFHSPWTILFFQYSSFSSLQTIHHRGHSALKYVSLRQMLPREQSHSCFIHTFAAPFPKYNKSITFWDHFLLLTVVYLQNTSKWTWIGEWIDEWFFVGSFKSSTDMGKNKLIPTEKNRMIQNQISYSNTAEIPLGWDSKCTWTRCVRDPAGAQTQSEQRNCKSCLQPWGLWLYSTLKTMSGLSCSDSTGPGSSPEVINLSFDGK